MSGRRHTRTREDGGCGDGRNWYCRMARTGAVGMVEIGTVGAAGEVAVGIAVSATTSGSSKVFMIKRIYIQNEWRLHQEVM